MELVYNKKVLGKILKRTDCVARLRNNAYDIEIVISRIRMKFNEMVFPGKEMDKEKISKLQMLWKKINKKQIAVLEKEADHTIDAIISVDNEAHMLIEANP